MRWLTFEHRGHAEIVRRFGRFSHRDAILGRRTTPAKRAFMEEGGFGGQGSGFDQQR